MYIFIFESIGMQELILIGAIALIIFGPRKLPQMAKTIGKTMTEFRRATNEFKETWEREVSMDEVADEFQKPLLEENTISKSDSNPYRVDEVKAPEAKPVTAPEIREVSAEELENLKSTEKIEEEDKPAEFSETQKQSWL